MSCPGVATFEHPAGGVDELQTAVEAAIDALAERFPAASIASTATVMSVPQARPVNEYVVPGTVAMSVLPR